MDPRINKEAIKYIREKLSRLVPVFANASIGDFTVEVPVLPEDDEFSELYAGIQLMQDVIREQVQDLKELNELLEQKVEQKGNELEKKEQDIREREQNFRVILNNSNNLFYTHDRTFVFSFLSPQSANFFGQDPHHLLPSGWRKFIAHDPVNSEGIKKSSIAMHTGLKQDPYELRLVCEEKTLWVLVSEVPIIKDGAVIGITGALIDITQRKKVEEEKEKLIWNLENSNRQLRDFAYIASHDLKAPIRAIGTLVSWILSDPANQLGEQGKEHFNLLISRAKRMNNLIDDLLQYSNIGKIREEVKEVKPGEIIKTIGKSIVSDKKVIIHVPRHCPAITCDPEMLSMLFRHLIKNAVIHNDKNYIEITVTCSDADPRFILFSVSDNGPGIPLKYHDKIFHIFQTLDTGPEKERTGIGLSIVKKIVELNNGKIWVESEEGKSTTFFFTFPKTV
jgi:PAS domain S-box-containing protein